MSSWQAWLAPGVLVAVAAVGTAYLESRFASVDRRFDTLTAEMSGQRDRTDRVIETLGDLRADVASVHSELSIVHRRVDRIGDHLEVTSLPDDASPTVASLEDALRTLQDAGFEFYSTAELPVTQVFPALQKWAQEGSGYFLLTPKGEANENLENLGVEVSPLEEGLPH